MTRPITQTEVQRCFELCPRCGGKAELLRCEPGLVIVACEPCSPDPTKVMVWESWEKTPVIIENLAHDS